MKKLKITLALSHYDRHIPFFDGTLSIPEELEIQALQVGQSVPLKEGVGRHERMIRKGEFDAAEVSLSSYIMAKNRNMPLTAIPVFPRRLFSQSQMYVLADSNIESPKDLIGKKIGRMLLDGEIDALIMPHPPKVVIEAGARIRRLFRDAKGEEIKYFRKNGYYPIMHIIALKQELVDREPWIAKALLALLEEAKKIYRDYYDDPNWSQMAWGRHYYEEERELLGDDPWPLGIKRNRANLERFLEYSLDQGLIDREMAVENLFAAPIVACSRKND